MKLHLKSFTFGMGTGIIILSLIFFITLRLTSVDNQPIHYSEEQIIDMAEELGMVFPQDETSSILGMNIEQDVINEEIEELEEQDEVPYNTDVTIFIDFGTSATDIAEMLYAENIIDDANSFNEYIMRTGFSNRLRAGTLTFKTNSSFEEAISVLIGRDLLPDEL